MSVDVRLGGSNFDYNSEVDSLNKNIEAIFSNKIIGQLNLHVESLVADHTFELRTILDKRLKAIGWAEENFKYYENKASALVEATNPKTIIDEIKNQSKLTSFSDDYYSLASKFDVGPLEGVIDNIQLPMSIFQPLLETSGELYGQINSAIEVLKKDYLTFINAMEKASDGWLARSVGLASGAAVGLSIVALPGAARGVGGAANESSRWASSKIIKFQTEEQYTNLIESLKTFSSELDVVIGGVSDRIQLLAKVVYGGLLVAIEKLLNSRGRSILWLDLKQGKFEIGLSKEQKAVLDAWAGGVLSQIGNHEASGEWHRVCDVAETAMNYCLLDPVRAKCAPHNGGGTYAILFARKRELSLNIVASMAWSEGRFLDAAKIYSCLLESPRVSWDNSQDKLQSSSVAIVRLLSVGTTKGTSNTDLNNFIETAVGYVARQSGKGGESDCGGLLNGQKIDLKTNYIFSAFMEFLKHKDCASRHLELLNECNLPAQALNGDNLKIIIELGEFSRGPLPKSSFVDWLYRRKKSLQYKRIIVRGFLFLLVIPLSWYGYNSFREHQEEQAWAAAMREEQARQERIAEEKQTEELITKIVSESNAARAKFRDFKEAEDLLSERKLEVLKRMVYGNLFKVSSKIAYVNPYQGDYSYPGFPNYVFLTNVGFGSGSVIRSVKHLRFGHLSDDNVLDCMFSIQNSDSEKVVLVLEGTSGEGFESSYYIKINGYDRDVVDIAIADKKAMLLLGTTNQDIKGRSLQVLSTKTYDFID